MKGPIVCDIAGICLTEEDKRRIAHPLVGMVILFTRNYENRAQLKALCDAIHAVKPGVLISVDHEGGRVQRFRAGFTEIPAMRTYGKLFEVDSEQAKKSLRAAAFILAAELRDCGVDFTFAPVLDLDWGRSAIIGERSLGKAPAAVATLARVVCEGFATAGMANCAKHFPGHGFAEADSHVSLPEDSRDAEEILSFDVAPYRSLTDVLASAMTAHVLYPKLDAVPASFSRKIATDILRRDAGFKGLLFSDDLSMAGAKAAGSIVTRAEKALSAGCDALIVCNDPAAVDTLLANLKWEETAEFTERAAKLKPESWNVPFGELAQNPEYQTALKQMIVGI